MDKKNTFIMYLDYEEHFSLLSDEEIGILMRGIFQYIRTGQNPNFKSIAIKMAFSFIKTNIDLDNQKYQQKCEKNKQIAEERWKRQREQKQEQEKRQFNGCHLGSLFKNDSCFKCQKKYICSLPESPDFKLSHPSYESFSEWNSELEKIYEGWCEDRKKQGKEVNLELFYYDWLNEPDDND